MPSPALVRDQLAAALVGRTIRERRSHLLIDKDRTVPRNVLESLCELASWAPCHKRTWPWQFAVCEDEGRDLLGDAVARALERAGARPAGVEKARTKYLRAPAVLMVGAAPDRDPERQAENRDATCAAVQNALLGATALGLASFWSTCPSVAQAAVGELCGFVTGSHVTGIIYLGWPTAPVDAPARPTPCINYVE